MRNYGRLLCIFGLQLIAVSAFAQPININSLTYSANRHHTRLLFAVSGSPEHRVFVRNNPSRLIIDINNATLGKALSQPSAANPLFSHVRAFPKNNTDLRIVVDLKQSLSPKNFSLTSNNNDEHRLLVDLVNKETVAATITEEQADTKQVARKSEEPAGKLNGNNGIQQQKPAHKIKSSETTTVTRKARTVIIAIDAGHGGEDPGARGPNGTEEKTVTFAIAQKLAALINGQPGMKAVMVRKSDYYVGLRERMKIARAAKADLFISIHADAFQNADVKGASVYTLSRSGASSEAARWLADSENASELIGGVSLDDKEDVLASVLLDLSQTATQEASQNIASSVLKTFQSTCALHRDTVQNAGFLVLKSPDIPSILVETAFISNPSEELNLLSTRYQSKMASAIFNGVRNYFKHSAPIDSRVAKL